ncbi:CKLF-like MARVEL transmembrane domain-containing protein 7 [Dreissena polymorpha]|uniref:CKLF-like MARVEL transmembrane domain-containing protein 7 n=1 Tax=Dreissena polymorpha TaxID=45954 RepID=UPI002263BA60|nr:CKLF-like MARVEL transmembrane domain-containing protein 7 [Dreissena polymorpha]
MSAEPEVIKLGFDAGYILSWRGILKITECVLDIAGFVTAVVWLQWTQAGGGYVQVVTMTAFVTTLTLFILHLFKIIRKLPPRLPWTLIQLIYYGLYSLMMLIAGIVSAGRAYHTSIILCAVSN